MDDSAEMRRTLGKNWIYTPWNLHFSRQTWNPALTWTCPVNSVRIQGYAMKGSIFSILMGVSRGKDNVPENFNALLYLSRDGPKAEPSTLKLALLVAG